MALAPIPPLNLTGGAGGAAGPATATQGGIGSITPAFDSSRWTVSTGSSKASATEGIPWYVLAGIAAVGAFVLWKKR